MNIDIILRQKNFPFLIYFSLSEYNSIRGIACIQHTCIHHTVYGVYNTLAFITLHMEYTTHLHSSHCIWSIQHTCIHHTVYGVYNTLAFITLYMEYTTHLHSSHCIWSIQHTCIHHTVYGVVATPCSVW